MVTGQETPWFRELYDRLMEYARRDCYGDVLLSWLPKARDAVSHLSEFRQFFLPTVKTDDFRFSLWNLYALSRVNDFLLLPFQHGGNEAWKGPQVTPEQYVTFFEEIGFTTS